MNFHLLELGCQAHGTCARYRFGFDVIADIGIAVTGFSARADVALGYAPAHGAALDVRRTGEFTALALGAPGLSRTESFQRYGSLERIGTFLQIVTDGTIGLRCAPVIVELARQIKRARQFLVRVVRQRRLRRVTAGTEQGLQTRNQVRAGRRGSGAAACI